MIFNKYNKATCGCCILNVGIQTHQHGTHSLPNKCVRVLNETMKQLLWQVQEEDEIKQ